MPINPVIRIIPADGPWPDLAAENLAYWLTRPPRERVQAARDLRRSSYRRLHRRDLPRMVRVLRPFPVDG
jgi:hypothetical protein